MTSDPACWSLTIDADRVAWLTIDVPGTSANSISRAVMEQLDAQLTTLERDKPCALVIQSGKASGFIAGADIKEFTGLTTPQVAYELVRNAHRVLDRLAALPYPTVAAINGFALGGGLELALACRYRVAANDSKVTMGFPEVMLGIHPGFGGTVRSARLIGAVASMELVLTGRSVRPQQALSMGLIDAVAPPSELAAAVKTMALNPPVPKRAPFKARLASLPLVRNVIAAQMAKMARKRARPEHYPAPFAAIELWRKYGSSDAAFDAEARSIAELFCTPTSRNLVRVFFLQDRLKGLAGKSPAPIHRVHVVGAGVMGGDIAAWCAVRGLFASLQDRTIDLVKPALERAKVLFEKRVRDPAERAKTTERLVADVDGVHIPQADVVIEAIYEDVDAKRALYERVEPAMKSNAVLGTNTSSIVLEILGEKLRDPGRLIGIHFFNPVAQMQLVEVVSTATTRPEVQQAALAFVRKLDKLPLPCRSAPGFVVNRVLFPYLIEAMLASEQGISPTTIDRVAVEFGMPMGPIELADVVGLDVSMHVGKILAEAFGKPAPTSVEQLVKEKKLGRKTGQGVYFWRDGKPVKPSEPAGFAVPTDLQDRLILPMINEAVAVLREQVVADADLLDAGIIFGTGFAPFRGGPLAYARTRGVDECVTCLEQLAAQHGQRFKPDAGWTLLK